jgi:hypothetical protein
MSGYPLFDLSALRLLPLARRRHDLRLEEIVLPLRPAPWENEAFPACGLAMRAAGESGAARVLMFGAHVLRRGCQRYIIDLMERGLVSCLAAGGAGAIHDYEFARIGASTESVAAYIKNGQFGLWEETGDLNDVIRQGASGNLGAGEAIGRHIAAGGFPYADLSVFAAAWRLRIPVTVHVGIGYDILCEHPNYDGAAWGKTSHTDFLILAQVFLGLEGGLVMNFGSAVMAPEVYLKALAMARNLADRQGRKIARFTTLVCDLHDPPASVREEAPKDSAAYYFRPWKTMLARTVADGGASWYVRGDHARTLPALWTAATQNAR